MDSSLQTVSPMDVSVLLADPRIDDPGWTPNDDIDLAGLKQALEAMPDVHVTYLDDHSQIIDTFRNSPPPFVFNLCDEGYMNVNETEAHLPALMEAFNIPFTGSSIHAITVSRDKSLVRMIAESAGVPVPKEELISFQSKDDLSNDILERTAASVNFPCIVKPRSGDGSTGITPQCIAVDIPSLYVAITKAFEETKQDVLVQTFLAGREFTVSWYNVGNPCNNDLTVLPLLEIDYSSLSDTEPRVQLYDGKRGLIDGYWDRVTHKHGKVSENVLSDLHRWCTILFEQLQLRDYCRFDFRMDTTERLYLLDVNPNNWIGGKFRKSGEIAGISWPQLLRKVIETASNRLKKNSLYIPLEQHPNFSGKPDLSSIQHVVHQISAAETFPAEFITTALHTYARHPRDVEVIVRAAVDASIGAATVNQRPRPPTARMDLATNGISSACEEDCIAFDEYKWMHDTDGHEFEKLIEDEYEYSEQVMAHTKQFVEQMAHEMRNREPTTHPLQTAAHGFEYFTVLGPDRLYPIHYRRAKSTVCKNQSNHTKKSSSDDAQILLDENELAKGCDVMTVARVIISPTGSLVAYAVDTIGSETYTLYVKEIETEQIVSTVENVTGLFFFSSCGNRIIYVAGCTDDLVIGSRVLVHSIGSQQLDPVIYEEQDPAFQVSLSLASSQQVFFINCNSQSTSEIMYLPSNLEPSISLCKLLPRRDSIEFTADHMGNYFYIRTNADGADNFKLISASVNNCDDPTKYSLILNDRAFVKIEGIRVFDNFLVAFERSHGDKHIRVMQRKGSDCPLDHYVRFPSHLHSFWDEDAGLDPVVGQKLNVAMQTSQPNILKTQIPDYDPDDYTEENYVAISEDGTRVPISIVYDRRQHRPRAAHPTILHGYGAYGSSVELKFESTIVSLLNRGVVYAIAHVRGGSEFGSRWYYEGRQLHKMNSMRDFIACAQHLISTGMTTPDMLAISGRSAGGLLVGAVLNMRPDLFKAALIKVPFVDVLTTMLDENIAWTAFEYEEWGDPHNPQVYRYIQSYCPYTNIRRQAYPHILCISATNDPYVSVREPAKWVARLRSRKSDRRPILLRVNQGGHMGSTGAEYYEDLAFEYAFLLDRLGLLTASDIQPASNDSSMTSAQRIQAALQMKKRRTMHVVRFMPRWNISA
eukprot:gene1665-4794_t